MGKLLQMLERWAGGGPGGKKRVTAFRWLLVVGLVGIMIMLLNTFISVKKINPSEGTASPPKQDQQVFLGEGKADSIFDGYEEKYESRLKDILENIVGVGEVKVLVTIESTEEIVVKSNNSDTQSSTEEKDINGANRRITEISRSGEVVLHEISGDQVPVVIKTIKPKIRGVIVVARGAENLRVKQLISEAVARGLDVPAHRISIMPSKQ